MKHINRLKAKSYHINRFGEVSTPFLFWYMQEIAWEHAHILGFGFEHLREDQLFWVLSRLLVRIDRRPRWTEEFTLETWSRGTDGFFAYRDYRFLDARGEEFIRATSSWLVLDLESRRIQRLSHHKNFPAYQESVLGFNARKVDSPAKADGLQYYPVMFNEIDINQHFNTGRYLERINNSYSIDFHASHKLTELEVNFMKEGMPEDSLGVNRHKLNDEEHLCSVVRKSDGAELIKARLVWEKVS
jgi:medium-chain acyl-[acyl-carrier-protein] hydrolase